MVHRAHKTSQQGHSRVLTAMPNCQCHSAQPSLGHLGFMIPALEGCLCVRRSGCES